MKNESVISRIISAIKGDKIAVRENMFFDTLKGNLDFELDDIPNWRAVLAVVPGGGTTPIVTAITGGVTPNPLTVVYGTMSNPTSIFRNADGSNYAGAANSRDNAYGMIPANSITLTGDDDGSGKFVDSFIWILKP